MAHFMSYLLEHHLREITEMFPRQSMNQLLQREIETVIPLVADPEIRTDLERLYAMDYSAYVDRSLRAVGVRDPDLDEYVHDILVRLLVSPGGLVSRWKRDAPLSFRFKRAVKNAVLTIATRDSRRKRRVREMPDDEVPVYQPQDENELINDFRKWLEDEHGIPHRMVFDARLEGRDTKDLIGAVVPSAFALKKIVQTIKASVVRWAGTDPSFQTRIRKLMDAEESTLSKRFRRDQVAM